MADIGSIPGIGKASLELLAAAGFRDLEALAKADVDELAAELDRANTTLGISRRVPGRAAIRKWIDSARKSNAMTEEATVPSIMPVNYELTPQVIQMLATAPLAIPLPARLLVESKLGVSDIPAALLLNRYTGDLEVNVEERSEERLPKSRPARPVGAPTYVRIADSGIPRVEIDMTRLKSTEDMVGARPKESPVNPTAQNGRVHLLRTTREATNKGRNPQSLWYIRGVLHSHPVSIYIGAATTVLLMFMIPIAVISAALLLLSRETQHHFTWVPGWLLVFPAALPAAGLVYLIFGLGGSCRVCGQKLFTHRAHLKNTKAHHIRGLGYVLPLCLQILIFRWFRCSHCGTPIRLKE